MSFPLQLNLLAEDKTLESKAFKLSKELGINFKGSLEELREKLPISNKKKYSKYFLVLSHEKIYLKKGLSYRTKPIYCDFLKWSKYQKKNNLLRSMRGIPETCTVIDATAGLGKDSLALSSVARKVILLEKIPWIYALLEDGLKNVTRQNSLISKMEAVCMDSEKYISSLKKKVDVIYIDLMFPGLGKSKAKREIQALRELVNIDINENLLSVSLKKAFERVIVKRHKNSLFLSGKEPTYTIKGRTTRYDIYSVKLI